MNNHVIHRQVLDLQISPKEKAFAIRQQLQDDYFGDVMSMLDTVLSDVAGDDEVLIIDKLEIDLGRLIVNEFGSNFREKLEQALREKLEQLRYESRLETRPLTWRERELNAITGVEPNSAVRKSSAVSQLEWLEHFFLTGQSPWWAGDTEETSLGFDEVYETLLEQQPETVLQLLRNLSVRRNALQRIVLQLVSKLRKKTIERLRISESSTARIVEALAERIRKVWSHSGEPFSEASAERFLLSALLLVSAQTSVSANAAAATSSLTESMAALEKLIAADPQALIWHTDETAAGISIQKTEALRLLREKINSGNFSAERAVLPFLLHAAAVALQIEKPVVEQKLYRETLDQLRLSPAAIDPVLVDYLARREPQIVAQIIQETIVSESPAEKIRPEDLPLHLLLIFEHKNIALLADRLELAWQAWFGAAATKSKTAKARQQTHSKDHKISSVTSFEDEISNAINFADTTATYSDSTTPQKNITDKKQIVDGDDRADEIIADEAENSAAPQNKKSPEKSSSHTAVNAHTESPATEKTPDQFLNAEEKNAVQPRRLIPLPDQISWEEKKDIPAEKQKQPVAKNETIIPEDTFVHEETTAEPEELEEPEFIPALAFTHYSGLVLLANFLPFFFKELDLLAEDGKTFRDEAATWKAVFLLHFIATGKTTATDDALALHKLLCGVELDQTSRKIRLSAKDKQEGLQLLDDAADQWTALRSASGKMLRKNFMQRRGLIDKNESDWLLQIEMGPLDVMLDTLPWGIGTIRLPWMNNLLHTELLSSTAFEAKLQAPKKEKVETDSSFQSIEDARQRLKAFLEENAAVFQTPPEPEPWSEEVLPEPPAAMTRFGGLVVVANFLPFFFDALQLLDPTGKKFRDEAAAQKAVFLLHFIATGKNKAPEHTLALHKLLCGIPLSQTLPRSIKLSEEEKTECLQLLDDAADQWTALRSGSGEMLRANFMRRNGILEKKDNGWQLRLERGALDVLLDTLPWSVGIIRLPWMSQLLHVEW